MISSGSFNEVLFPGLREIYGLGYTQFEKQYDGVFEILTSTKAVEDDMNVAGFGLAQVKDQGAAISYDIAYQGWKTRYVHTTYGLGFKVPRELYDDDLYNIINRLPASLAKSVAQTEETINANHLIRSFSGTSAYYGADSKDLCATDHPTVIGGSFSNEMSTPATLSVTALETAYIGVGAYVDGRGLKMNARATELIIPLNLEWTAKEVLKSEKRPEAANHAINPAKGFVPYRVMNWLTSTTNWWLKTDVPNSLIHFWRRRPEFSNDNDFDTENAKYKVVFRFSSGWSDPRGLYGVAI